MYQLLGECRAERIWRVPDKSLRNSGSSCVRVGRFFPVILPVPASSVKVTGIAGERPPFATTASAAHPSDDSAQNENRIDGHPYCTNDGKHSSVMV